MLLRRLREKGVLIIGSGNIVPNMAQANIVNQHAIYDWAEEFDNWIANLILSRDWPALLTPEHAGAAFRMVVPTEEHYFPLL